MPVVGITGGVGTGKSEVARLLAEHGAELVSADQVAREILAPGSAELAAVAQRFGQETLCSDGSLDRERLAKVVFADARARRDLERLTHPTILRRLRERIDEARRLRGERAVVAVEVPLLYEAGMADWFDRVVVVAADVRTQVERLAARDGMSDAEVRLRIAAQMPIAEKVARADTVIWNDGGYSDLVRQVNTLWEQVNQQGGERSGTG